MEEVKLSGLTDAQAEEYANALRSAMKGIGTDEDALIAVSSKLNSKEAQQVRQKYSEVIKRDLVADLKSECGGKLEDGLVAIFTSPAEYDADRVRQAIKGIGTNEELLLDTLPMLSGLELKEMASVYKSKYNGFVAQDVSDDLGGDLKKLFTVLLNTDHSVVPPDSQIEDDVLRLFKAGEDKVGTDDKVFFNILAGYPREYVAKLAEAYGKKHGRSLESIVKKEFGGKIEGALLAFVRPRHEELSLRLRESMKGAGTDEKNLLHYIVRFRDTLLKPAAEHFLKTNEKSLDKWVDSEVRSDFKKLLISVIKEHAY